MGFYSIFTFVYGYYINKSMLSGGNRDGNEGEGEGEGEGGKDSEHHTINDQVLVGVKFSPKLIPMYGKSVVNPTDVVNFINSKMEINKNTTMIDPTELISYINSNSRETPHNEFQRYYMSLSDGIKSFDEDILSKSFKDPECLETVKLEFLKFESDKFGEIARPCEPKFYVNKSTMCTW